MNAELRRLRTRHDLTVDDIAGMAEVGPSTVERWLHPRGLVSWLNMPEWRMEKLMAKLKRRKSYRELPS